MSKILVFCGSKQAGKTSAAKFVTAYMLREADVIGGDFRQDYDGEIEVQARFQDPETGEKKTHEEYALLDFSRTDFEFVRYAEKYIWPHVRIYSFADALKMASTLIFGLDPLKLNGTNEDKNELTHIRWKDMEKLFPVKKPSSNELMTYREFLQFFGTNVCRAIMPNCWLEACFNIIKSNPPSLAIIDDCRFPNEVYGSKQYGAKLIYLDKKVDNDPHSSETALGKLAESKPSPFDYFIYNQKLTLVEKNKQIFSAMKNWGWVSGDLK